MADAAMQDELVRVHLSDDTLSSLPNSVSTPRYDRTLLTPGILHIGLGNFHRAHQAIYLDRLFDTGRDHDWAIVGASIRKADGAIRGDLAKQDWLSTVVELDPSDLSARVCGAMIDYAEIEPEAVVATMTDPAIRIVSLTITEGGYFVEATTGGFDKSHPDIQADAASPDAPKTVFGCILKALRARRDAGTAPFTVMCCDNLPENGHVTRATTLGLAALQDETFRNWVAENVAFPNSMVDCITPATSQREIDMVTDTFGIIDARPVACEPFRQWV
ncbi:MAG: mannitol dehydrogenase family protein, partial [Pseudomonadota bacterium]